MRHTFTGDKRAENMISGALATLRAELENTPEKQFIRAVLLGGGYGRGEGGVTADGGLSNDLDFFVVPKDGAPRFNPDFFERLAAPLRKTLGIDVDFFPVPDSGWLVKNAETLMVRELAAGHEIVFGDPAIEADLPPPDWANIPGSEGARLFLNRGAGLLLARRETLKAALDRLFIFRNIAKAALGCGDALLIAHGAYLRTGMERAEALTRISAPDGLAEKYRAALDWKYRPVFEISPDAAAPEAVADAARLWHVSFDFFNHAEVRGETAEPLKRRIKNALLTLRYAPGLFRIGAFFPLCKHPRVKLLRPLARLLNELPAQEEIFLKMWNRFN